MTQYVYGFSEGSKDQKDLLGGKGANLSEMTNLGLPVPPGFTITTEACRAYLEKGDEPAELAEQVAAHLAELETTMGKTLGQADDPLLVSVRSGAKFSMPGMMETVLNIGLNDESVHGLTAQSGDERFAYDSYRRLLTMFGKTVLGIEGELLESELEAKKHAKGSKSDLDLDADDFRDLVTIYKAIIKDHAGRDFPQDPREQLDMAVRAVFDSWNTERAVLYRRQERIPSDLGTAVNVMAMVFGNVGMDSGTGVAFTRDPASGHQGVYGDYLQNAQGEDVVAGIRNTVPLADLEKLDKKSYDELMAIMKTLEEHYKDLCDIEFTVEHGKLWMLQTRVGKRTAEAAFRIATQLVDQGLIDMDEAVRRVNGAQLAQLMFPRFDASADKQLIGTGMNASPGAAVGKAVFDSTTAVEWSERGEPVILVRRETNPDDLKGMVAAKGILTSRGGKTSHAAVVARGMGRTCVCGADSLDVDVAAKRFVSANGHTVNEGDVISIDGTTGEIYDGDVPVADSLVVRYFEGDPTADEDELVFAVERIMQHADKTRRLRVRANADTPEDALRARRFGAQGIGLCRTEHMFLGERRELVEHLIVAESVDEQEEALSALLPLQRQDFIEILEAMDGLPVTIRLIDPPLHEFLPDLTDLSVEVAIEDDHGNRDSKHHKLLDAVKRLHEQNPMLGMRGVRLGIVIPGLFKMQARAILEAAAERKKAGGDPQPEIMIPLVAAVQELELVKAEIISVAADVEKETGVDLDFKVGTMIELPRAVMTADEIA
ncbi:MAG TPA: pyruvate, phosphate dikinase, partial [Nocardioidaceae bacterium]|nr:pyruvate, phosphate dikinase [Nocardioidaceae bacterium]